MKRFHIHIGVEKLEEACLSLQFLWSGIVETLAVCGIVGGLIGAAILPGNQIGSGSGRTTATAAGAIIGALSGDRLENNAVQQANVETISSEQPVQRCRMVDNFESRTTGFNVTYEYKGRQYSSVLPFDPGNRLKVNVTVTPVQ